MNIEKLRVEHGLNPVLGSDDARASFKSLEAETTYRLCAIYDIHWFSPEDGKIDLTHRELHDKIKNLPRKGAIYGHFDVEVKGTDAFVFYYGDH